VLPKALVVAVVLVAAAASAALRIASMIRSKPPATFTTAPVRVLVDAPHYGRAPVPPAMTSGNEVVPVDELPVAPRPKADAPARRPSREPLPAPVVDAGVTESHLVPESPWVTAASAMRSGDYVAAERAFDALATAPDARTRDSARLARAQVWFAQGRRAEARRELEDLARNSATAIIRNRAREALDISP
jgi:hypothetical protein